MPILLINYYEQILTREQWYDIMFINIYEQQRDENMAKKLDVIIDTMYQELYNLENDLKSYNYNVTINKKPYPDNLEKLKTIKNAYYEIYQCVIKCARENNKLLKENQELHELKNNRLYRENFELRRKIVELQQAIKNNTVSKAGRRSKFNNEQENKIFEQRQNYGYTVRKLAEIHSCSVGTIQNIINKYRK